MRGEGQRKLLRELMDWWTLRYPTEAASYVKECQLTRQLSKRTSGMSDGGTLMNKAIIPTRLFAMAEKLSPGFWREGGYSLFEQEFKNLSIKKPK